jgi:hypothetical protein
MRTYLLFPYVACIAGYDTGISISNTGAAPFGTAGESGVCTFHYYGFVVDGTQPTPQSSGVMSPGETFTFVLSTGGGAIGLGPNGMDNRAAGFSGYIVVECHFRFAHGFAAIGQLGGGPTSPRVGYLATRINPNRDGE